MKKYYVFAGLALLAASPGFAQVKIGAAGAPDGSAMLEVTSGAANNKGMLLPRVTTAQRNAIASPATGLMIYNTTTNEAQVNTGTAAAPVWSVTTAAGWNTTGNAGTNPATNFIGTTDNQPLVVRTNNTEKLRITAAGNVGIGNATPGVKLQITDTGNVAMRIGNALNGGSGGDLQLGNPNHGLRRNLTTSGGTLNDVAVYTSTGTGATTVGSLYLVSNLRANGSDSLPLNQFVLKNNGFIGIGTKTPAARLHIDTGSIRVSNGPVALTSPAIQVINDGGGNAANDNIVISSFGASTQPSIGTESSRGTFSAPQNSQAGDNIGNFFFNSRVNGSVANSNVIRGVYLGDGTTNRSRLNFFTSNTLGLSIDSNQNVGMGTAAPAVKLQIVDTGDVSIRIGNAGGTRGHIQLGNNNHGLIRDLTRSGGNINDVALYTSTGSAPGTNSSLYLVCKPTSNGADSLPLDQFVLKNNGDVGIGTGNPHNLLDLGTTIGSSITDPAGKKLAVFNSASGANFYGLGISGSTLQFHAGSGPNGAPFMVLLSNSNVGIGTNTPAYKLDVAGDINASGAVRSNGVALTSDVRLKRNITNTQHGLSTIMALRPVEYEKKNSIRGNEYNRHEIGFIAQEIGKVLPGLVTEGKDADKTLAVSYTELIPVLTKAIQEQQAQIETLKEKNTQLEAANKTTAQLVERVKQMEQMMGFKEIEGASKVAGK